MKTEKSTAHPMAIIRVSLILVMAVMLSFTAENLRAQTAEGIDGSVYACLGRFYAQIKRGREMVAMAEGVLVMSSVVKGGFIVGGDYGEGALRVGGKTVSYYNLVTGSFGLQVGGEAKDIVILFMTDDALKKFRAGTGWEVGVDGNVALANFGGGERIDFITMKDPIIGFVFDAKGLMADISLNGAKFTKINAK